MSLKCFFGFHEWEKFMGPQNRGNGKFSQKYICKKCKKIKEIISQIRDNDLKNKVLLKQALRANYLIFLK